MSTQQQQWKAPGSSPQSESFSK